MITRRRLFQLGGAAALTLPFVRLRAQASPRSAKRLVIFYFPDGIVGASQSGQPSQWRMGSELLAPLVPYQDKCVVFRGLSMGPADSGSHPGGAKKLLTATDGGNHISIDQRLASTVGAGDPFRLLYLGAQANANNASGDKHISYVAPGFTTPPDDDPVGAFKRVFGGGGTTAGGGGGGGTDGRGQRRLSVLDNARGELEALRTKLGDTEKTKLDLHVEAVREVEKRIGALSGGGGGGGSTSCSQPSIEASGLDAKTLYAPERFPQVLRAQIDLMVQAMACGMTRVGVIQASHYTSELIMSRFASTPMHDPSFDMRSHQASHYGASHDPMRREFRAFAQQVRWWIEQFAYLLAQLAARPEGQGTMLDESLVLLCSEIADGNTHLHDDMPFVLAGGGGGTIRTGRFLDVGYRRHGDLLVSIANAMGDGLTSFGDASSGPLPGLLA